MGGNKQKTNNKIMDVIVVLNISGLNTTFTRQKLIDQVT